MPNDLDIIPDFLRRHERVSCSVVDLDDVTIKAIAKAEVPILEPRPLTEGDRKAISELTEIKQVKADNRKLKLLALKEDKEALQNGMQWDSNKAKWIKPRTPDKSARIKWENF